MNLTWWGMNERSWAVMRALFQQGIMIRDESVACPGWPVSYIHAEGVPGALAAEPNASAAGSAPVPKAMPKAARQDATQNPSAASQLRRHNRRSAALP